MRKKLEDINDVRGTFRGTFEREGIKRGWKGRMEKTILLTDIKDCDDNPVAGHLWFNLTKEFDECNLKHGDIVQFRARVTEYEKGYFGYRDDVYKPHEIDYKLSHPRCIEVIGHKDIEDSERK